MDVVVLGLGELAIGLGLARVVLGLGELALANGRGRAQRGERATAWMGARSHTWTSEGTLSSQCGREGSRGPEGPRGLSRERVPAPLGCSKDEDRTGCGGRAWRIGLLFFRVRLAARPSMTWRAELAGVSWF